MYQDECCGAKAARACFEGRSSQLADVQLESEQSGHGEQ